MSRIKKRRIITFKNKTGFNGVCKVKGGKFQAQISIDGEKKYLGTFTEPRDAAMAYDEAIVANQLPYKKLNFPYVEYANRGSIRRRRWILDVNKQSHTI